MQESSVMPHRPEPKPGEGLKQPEVAVIPPRDKPVQDITDVLPKVDDEMQNNPE